MRRRPLLLAAAVVLVAGVAAVGIRRETFLLLDWAKKAAAEKPPVAVLIEMGLKDAKPTMWNGRAEIKGAKLVRSEGYRFQKEDTLKDGPTWEAKSRRPFRAPAGKPAV